MRGSSDHTSEWLEEKTRNLRGGRSPRIEIYVRSLAPPIGVREQQERVLDRLSSLERRGVVEAVDVTVWGEAISPEGSCVQTAAGSRLFERADRLRSWGEDLAVSVDLPFEERTVASSITDEQYPRIVLPRFCLGVYEGDELSLVLPAVIDGVGHCVDDFLTALERTQAADAGLETSA